MEGKYCSNTFCFCSLSAFPRYRVPQKELLEVLHISSVIHMFPWILLLVRYRKKFVLEFEMYTRVVGNDATIFRYVYTLAFSISRPNRLCFFFIWLLSKLFLWSDNKKLLQIFCSARSLHIWNRWKVSLQVRQGSFC